MPRPRKHPNQAARLRANAEARLARGISRKYLAAGPDLQAKIETLRTAWELDSDAATITRAIEICYGVGLVNPAITKP